MILLIKKFEGQATHPLFPLTTGWIITCLFNNITKTHKSQLSVSYLLKQNNKIDLGLYKV